MIFNPCMTPENWHGCHEDFHVILHFFKLLKNRSMRCINREMKVKEDTKLCQPNHTKKIFTESQLHSSLQSSYTAPQDVFTIVKTNVKRKNCNDNSL